MPGYDGKGPQGSGPNGRGLGPCGDGVPRGGGGGFFGLRRGRRGGGRGVWGPQRFISDKEALEGEKSWLEQRLESIKGALDQMGD